MIKETKVEIYYIKDKVYQQIYNALHHLKSVDENWYDKVFQTTATIEERNKEKKIDNIEKSFVVSYTDDNLTANNFVGNDPHWTIATNLAEELMLIFRLLKLPRTFGIGDIIKVGDKIYLNTKAGLNQIWF